MENWAETPIQDNLLANLSFSCIVISFPCVSMKYSCHKLFMHETFYTGFYVYICVLYSPSGKKALSPRSLIHSDRVAYLPQLLILSLSVRVALEMLCNTRNRQWLTSLYAILTAVVVHVEVVVVQCRNLIPALNAWAVRAYYTTGRPIATDFPWH